MSDEIAVIAIANALPGREAEVEAAIQTCVELTRAEPGCCLYTANTDVSNPARFVFIERWIDKGALEEHEKAPHFQAMAQTLATCLAGPLHVLILHALF